MAGGRKARSFAPRQGGKAKAYRVYVEPPQRRIGARGVPLSADVDHVEVFVPILRDVVLSAGQVIAQQQVKYPGRLLGLLRQHPDEPPRLRLHGGQPHHLRVVLAQSLGALDIDLLALQLFQDIRLLLLRVGEPGLFAGLLFAGDLEQGRLGDIDVALPDQGWGTGGRALSGSACGSGSRPRRHRCR